MAFSAEQISNWVQHDAAQGRCVRCGLPLHESVSGIVWAKEGDVLTCPPPTNWEPCSK
jgi:hypothetical protein